MPQSLTKVYVHLVFSTKNRYPFIDDSIKEELFSYLGGVCKELESSPIRVGGYSDHVHILCILSKKIALMDLLEEVKKRSSKWIKTKGEAYKFFYWQDGYGAFSVNPTEVEVVAKYIENQAEHHNKKDFKEEYLGFLNKYKVDYNEKYLWD
jgi:putative transposase